MRYNNKKTINQNDKIFNFNNIYYKKPKKKIQINAAYYSLL